MLFADCRIFTFISFICLYRRNWKKRWFILKDTLLTYHENDQDGSKVLGTIDLRSCRYILILFTKYFKVIGLFFVIFICKRNL